MRVPDLALAFRNIFRRPGFAAVAISLMAVGAGANAAVFSVVRGVLLRPLPFPQPQQLVAIWPSDFISGEDIVYWRERARSFSEVGGLAGGWMMGLVAEGGEPIKVTGARITDNLFRTLGAGPALGRAIEPGDGVNGRHRSVVLSHELWQRRFDSDAGVLGRIVQLDAQPYTVIGVMPRGFELIEPGTDLWVPLVIDARSAKSTFVRGIGRLSPGATPETATGELQALVPDMRRDLGRSTRWGQTLNASSLHDTTTGEVRPALLILLGAVGLILLLASVNLGTLVLGRSIERASEMAVRTALGASRGRLVRQIVTEQAVLAIAGALGGIALARVALPALVSRIPPEMPRTSQIALDWTVLATVLVVSVTVAVAVALVPALVTSRPSLQPLLRQSRATDTPNRRRALGALVTVQIALAVVLGIGAMLMLRSLYNLQHVDPGFDPNGVLTFRLQTTSKFRALGDGLPYLRRVEDRVRALPGVTSVGATGHLPLSGYSWGMRASRSDQPPAPDVQPPQVGWRFVDRDYFEVMRIPLHHGRGFTDRDTAAAPTVGIINMTLAREFFGEPAQAIGRTLTIASGARPGTEQLEIVGVIGDVRHLGLEREPMPEVFRPFAQTFMFPMAIVARTSVPPAQLAAAVRQLAHEIDPIVPVAELQPLTTLVAGNLGRPRLVSFLLSVFAAVGLALGLLGVYGVAAYRVRQREREIGIRLALGAAPTQMAGSIVAQGVGHALTGVAVGLPAAFLLSRVMSSLVFGVTATDPLTFAALPSAVILATASACYLPARRAARIDPVVAIRQE